MNFRTGIIQETIDGIYYIGTTLAGVNQMRRLVKYYKPQTLTKNRNLTVHDYFIDTMKVSDRIVSNVKNIFVGNLVFRTLNYLFNINNLTDYATLTIFDKEYTPYETFLLLFNVSHIYPILIDVIYFDTLKGSFNDMINYCKNQFGHNYIEVDKIKEIFNDLINMCNRENLIKFQNNNSLLNNLQTHTNNNC